MIAWSREILDAAEDVATQVVRNCVDALCSAGVARDQIATVRVDNVPDLKRLQAMFEVSVLEVSVDVGGGWAAAVEVLAFTTAIKKIREVHGCVRVLLDINATHRLALERPRLLDGLVEGKARGVFPLLGSEP